MTQTEALNQAKQKIESAMKCHPNAVPHLLGEAWDFINEALAQPEQEPVAWMSEHRFDELRKGFTVMTTLTKQRAFEDDVAIYTTPPQRKPLTDEQFKKIKASLSRQEGWDGDGWDLALKEAIEAAHGIK